MEKIRLVFSDKITQDTRYEKCKKCDKFTKLKFCKECGCFMPLKVKIAHSSCPLQKWSNPWNSW